MASSGIGWVVGVDGCGGAGRLPGDLACGDAKEVADQRAEALAALGALAGHPLRGGVR